MFTDPPAGFRVRDISVPAVYFNSERDTVPKPIQVALWEYLGPRHRLRTAKKGCPCFSTVSYKEGARRSRDGVQSTNALVFDFDHLDNTTAEEVLKHLSGIAHIRYTSFSHHLEGRDDCCFRVILFLSRPVEPGEHRRVWEHTHRSLGGYADQQASDIARIFYVPACPEQRLHQAELLAQDGKVLDIEAILQDEPDRSSVDTPSTEGSRATDSKPNKGEQVTKGTRHSTLLRLAGSMRRKNASEDAIAAALLNENRRRCHPPLPEQEVRRIARSVGRYAPASPMQQSLHTDMGNAEAFAYYAQDKARYVHARKSWYLWDGRRWKRDDSQQILLLAKDMLRDMAAASEAIEEVTLRKLRIQHARRSENQGPVRALLKGAGAMLALHPGEMDQQPWTLNCRNGTLDLQSGQLHPHQPTDHISRLVDLDYEPTATCPRWERFLETSMGGDQELIGFLQRAVGYSLTSLTSEQVFFILFGLGANGKSTFLETLRRLIPEFSTNTEFKTFLRKDNDGVSNEIARLAGARLVTATEPESGRPLSEAVVKRLTGGDVETARFLYSEPFEFKPTFKIWLSTNHRPPIRDTDHGIWRRICEVPFTVTIPEEERDPRLFEKLYGELEGILAWAVRGCWDWQEKGLAQPTTIRQATLDYRAEMDTVGRFIEERCRQAENLKEPIKALHTAYEQWCSSEGEEALSKRALGVELRRRGFTTDRHSQVRFWCGIGLEPGYASSHGYGDDR